MRIYFIHTIMCNSNRRIGYLVGVRSTIVEVSKKLWKCFKMVSKCVANTTIDASWLNNTAMPRLRYRTVWCPVTEMYLQVYLEDRSRPAQGFLWTKEKYTWMTPRPKWSHSYSSPKSPDSELSRAKSHSVPIALVCRMPPPATTHPQNSHPSSRNSAAI